MAMGLYAIYMGEARYRTTVLWEESPIEFVVIVVAQLLLGGLCVLFSLSRFCKE